MYNQSNKLDNGKLMLELIPPECYISLGKILTYGANKYGPNCWQSVEPKRYVGALLRHLTAYLIDPTSVDEESGLLHIDHLLCNAMFLSYLVNKEGGLTSGRTSEAHTESILPPTPRDPWCV